MKNIKKIILIILCSLLLSMTASVQADETTKQKAYELYQQQSYDKALKYFLALSEEEIDEEIMILISNSYDSIGEKVMAYNTLQELIKKYPKNYRGYYNLGVLNHKNGNLDFAIDCFDKAVRVNKKSSEANYNLACCFLEKQEYKLALKYFKKALKYNSKNYDVYYNLAYTYKMLGKEKKSQKFLEKYHKFS